MQLSLETLCVHGLFVDLQRTKLTLNPFAFAPCSVSTYPDQPTEQRRLPIHLPGKSLR